MGAVRTTMVGSDFGNMLLVDSLPGRYNETR